MIILLLSGPVAVGKSSIARVLCEDHGFTSIRSGRYLERAAAKAGLPTSRRALQCLGDSLDAKTDYSWIVDEVARPAISTMPEKALWLLDCVRKQRQVEHFRSNFPGCVQHAHLVADEATLEARYTHRLALGGEYLGNTPYSEAKVHPNEISSRQLKTISDAIFDVNTLEPASIAVAITERLITKG